MGTNIERTLERTGHLVAGIARKVERQRVGLPAAGHGHRTFLDAGITRYGIILHPDIPRAVREKRMGITERTAADLTDFRRYRSAVEVGDYRIGSVRQIIFVVIVLILTAEAEMEGYSPVKVTQRLIDKVEVPK